MPKDAKQLMIILVGVVGLLIAIFFPISRTANENSQIIAGSISQLPVLEDNLPVLKPGADLIQFDAPIVYAVDLKTETVLFEKNSTMRWKPASLTKLMTALVVLNTVFLDEIVEIETVDTQVAQPIMGLKKDEQITVENLLRGMLIASANDAANALARVVTGSDERFVNLMNIMAKNLKMQDTRFTNSVGFDNDEQLTTAQDLKKLTFEFLKNDKLAEMVQHQTDVVRAVDGGRTHWLTSSNKLLAQKNIFGVKTGYTDAARGNLIVLAADDSNEQILTIIMGSENREAETTKLVNWVFNSYEF